jgi:hypothetical protein
MQQSKRHTQAIREQLERRSARQWQTQSQHRKTRERFVGEGFPLNRIIAETDFASVGVGGGIAFPSGFQFDLHVVFDAERCEPFYWGALLGIDVPGAWGASGRGLDSLPDEALVVTFVLADGRAVSPLHLPPADTDAGDDFSLVTLRGSHMGSAVDATWWLTPLPTGKAMSISVHWPQAGIDGARARIDLAAIRKAAEVSRELPHPWDPS